MANNSSEINFHHPVTGAGIRESLETHDPGCAEMLRQRIELEVSLSAPHFRAADISPTLHNEIYSWSNSPISDPYLIPTIPKQVCATPTPLAKAKQRSKRPSFIYVNNRLEGNALNTIKAMTDA